MSPIWNMMGGGTDVSDATASASHILTGHSAYIATGKVDGTMPDSTESTDITAVAQEVTIAEGYHDGTGTVQIAAADQAKLIAGNIKSGVTILGVAGDSNVVDTSSGDAVAANIYTGKKAWVDGVEITGTSVAVDTSDATATADNILGGKTAYGSAGTKLTGTATDATVVKTRDANQRPLTVDHYGDSIKQYQYYCPNSSAGTWIALTGITFKDTLTTINNNPFGAMPQLLMTEIPSSVTTLGQYAFSGCAKVTFSVFPSSLNQSSLYGTFQGCSLITISSTPNCITTVDIAAFNQCTAITTMNMPRVATVNGAATNSGAFRNCTSLSTVTIGSSGYPVTTVQSLAFNGCTAMTAFTIYVTDPGNPPAAVTGGEATRWGAAATATVTYAQA